MLTFKLLGLLSYMVVIAARSCSFMEMLLDKFVPALYKRMGVFLAFDYVNCADHGAALFMSSAITI